MRPMLSTVLAVAIIAACKGKAHAPEGTSPPDQQGMAGMKMDSMPMGSMPTGGRDHMGMGGGAMMTMMPAHMDSMMRMSPERMSGMMAAHEAMMSRMLDGMGSDMRKMQMTGDARWNGLMDSVKADLADLPGLQGGDLSVGAKAHAGRVRRLMAMHQGMMKGE